MRNASSESRVSNELVSRGEHVQSIVVSNF
jgi:hypothetical protein